MERAALYRRALAPVSFAVGALGLAGGLLGWFLDIQSARGFVVLWLLTAITGLATALLIMRRQALRDGEPFWSPPARRVAQAMLPALACGLLAGAVVAFPESRDPLDAWWLPGIWMLLFGCATHAAGFFMPRGMKLVGWGFAVVGALCTLYVNAGSQGAGLPPLRLSHLLMGGVFGGLHVAYGIYLAATERRASST